MSSLYQTRIMHIFFINPISYLNYISLLLYYYNLHNDTKITEYFCMRMCLILLQHKSIIMKLYKVLYSRSYLCILFIQYIYLNIPLTFPICPQFYVLFYTIAEIIVYLYVTFILNFLILIFNCKTKKHYVFGKYLIICEFILLFIIWLFQIFIVLNIVWSNYIYILFYGLMLLYLMVDKICYGN